MEAARRHQAISTIIPRPDQAQDMLFLKATQAAPHLLGHGLTRLLHEPAGGQAQPGAFLVNMPHLVRRQDFHG
jgi:hypothetical protein